MRRAKAVSPDLSLFVLHREPESHPLLRRNVNLAGKQANRSRRPQTRRVGPEAIERFTRSMVA